MKDKDIVEKYLPLKEGIGKWFKKKQDKNKKDRIEKHEFEQHGKENEIILNLLMSIIKGEKPDVHKHGELISKVTRDMSKKGWLKTKNALIVLGLMDKLGIKHDKPR